MAAKYAFSFPSFTPEAVAAATGYTNNKYMAVKGGGSGQLVKVTGLMLAGLHGSSTPMSMILGRDSTVGASLTALADPASLGLLGATSTAPATLPLAFTAAGTAPQRSNDVTLGKLVFPINGYSGRVQWYAPPGGEMTLYGNSASLGELSLAGGPDPNTPGKVGGTIFLETD